MKLTNTRSSKSTKGMTLLELTVVILVLLSLISILFVGARAWKKGSDRSANVMNIRNCQQAMRGYQNMYQKKTGDGFTKVQLVDYVKYPTEPNTDVTYSTDELVTAQGVLWLKVAGPAEYAPTNDTSDW
jgi:type II secretory pathway pseudopilin PulG